MADIDCFMAAIRQQESGGNYGALNRGSGASGAYQFTLGTWRTALGLAGLGGSQWAAGPARDAPPAIQDAAAHALMSSYFNRFGNSWFNVAEAWYGGPGAVGHPNWGGGPGYPNVGQYATQVIHIMNGLQNCAPQPTYQPPPESIPPNVQPLNDAWDFLGSHFNNTMPNVVNLMNNSGIY